MSEPTPADVLRDAATVVRTKGWCRGQLRSPDGRLCAEGAMHVAAARLGAGTHPISIALKSLATVAGQPYNPLKRQHPAVVWNDEVAIDGEDVAVHMEKAAARWEETAGLESSNAGG